MNIIEVKNLVKVFDGLTAVNDISFAVPQGQIFAFLGPNGTGKTTSIKMLTTLLRPTSGHILLNGADPVAQQDAVRHSFGIVFHDPSLDDELTTFENLEFHGVLYEVPKEKCGKRFCINSACLELEKKEYPHSRHSELCEESNESLIRL